MESISEDIVAKAVAIMGKEDVTEEDIKAQVATLVTVPVSVPRLIDWIREAFGHVYLKHVENEAVILQKFSARLNTGEWIRFPLTAEPIYRHAVSLAQQMIHSGQDEAFLRIAGCSAVMDTIIKFQEAGASLKGSINLGPFLLGVPAETYPTEARLKEPLFTRAGYWLGKLISRLFHKNSSRGYP